MRSASPRRIAATPSRSTRSGLSPKRTASAVEPSSATARIRKVAASAYSKRAIWVSITSALAATWTRKRPSSPSSISRWIILQRLVAGADDIAAFDPLALGLRVVVVEARQLGGEERARGADVGMRQVEPGDLPIPAGEGELELRVDDGGRARLRVVAGRRDIGDQRLEIDAELLVEIRLRGTGVERGETEPGEHQDRRTPEGGGDEQPRGDRLRVERLAQGHQSQTAGATRRCQLALLRLARVAAPVPPATSGSGSTT